MDSRALIASLQEAVPGIQLESVPAVDRHTTIFVPRDHLLDVARALRARADLRYAVLAELTAVDWWPREPRYELVYILVSLERPARLRLKVRLDGDAARVPTLSGVWPSANWLEREVWDLFGIVFEEHPGLDRLLMPEDWEGHPLRKDYPVQINMRARIVEPLQVSEEEFRANLLADWLARRPV